MPRCYTCGNLIPIESLYEHGLLYHAFTECNPIYCGEIECYKKFSNFKLFKRHLLNMHKMETNNFSQNTDNILSKKIVVHHFQRMLLKVVTIFNESKKKPTFNQI